MAERKAHARKIVDHIEKEVGLLKLFAGLDLKAAAGYAGAVSKRLASATQGYTRAVSGGAALDAENPPATPQKSVERVRRLWPAPDRLVYGAPMTVKKRFFARADGDGCQGAVRERAAAALGCATIKVATQTHSATCLPVTDPAQDTGEQEADALVTTLPGVGLGVLTADCVPALMWGERPCGTRVVAAAHAGWRGALDGVLESALAAMGARDVRASIGPCITQESYAVSPGFEAPFLAEDPACEKFFAAGRFDLPGYAAFRLARAGVERVCRASADNTFARPDAYYSYRRGARDGRNLSAICIAG